MAAKETLQQIIGLDEKIAELREQYDGFPPEEQEEVLCDFYKEALGKLGESEPVPIGLVRVAEMLLSLGSDNATRLLSDGLAHPNPDARLLSGDALLHLAEEGLELIMPAVEAALEDGGLRAEEMAFMLSDVDHPEVPRVLERFLKLDRADVVAAAIEALAEIGDPSSVPALETLGDDPRKIAVEEDGAKRAEWTIGQLVKDAVEMLTEED